MENPIKTDDNFDDLDDLGAFRLKPPIVSRVGKQLSEPCGSGRLLGRVKFFVEGNTIVTTSAHENWYKLGTIVLCQCFSLRTRPVCKNTLPRFDSGAAF
jgi:hypothetical protein